MSNQVEKWSEQKLRETLCLLPEKEFQHTAEFVAFLEQLRLYVAPQMVSRAGREGYQMETTDAEHMVFLKLITEAGQHPSGDTRYLADYVAESVNPWGYLVGCATNNWLREEYGIRGISAEGDYDLVANIPARRDSDPAAEPEGELTPAWQIAELTYGVLAPRTPEKLHRDLWELLKFLAANPSQRLSYEHHERVAAKQYCAVMNESQIAAVMNIAWGGRPNRATTSIMGQFLLDPEFDPFDSRKETFAKALSYYQKEIIARGNGSRVLEQRGV